MIQKMKAQLKNKKWGSLALKGLILALAVLGVIWINSLNIQDSAVQDYASRFGYAGLFLVSIISGFNILLPIPVAAFFPALMDLGFNPAATVAIISIGMLAGDALGYFIGYTGRSLIDEQHKNPWFARIQRLREKNEMFPMFFLAFYASFVPLPNELVVIPMAFFRYKWWHMMLALFVGNLIFNTIFALGFTSLSSLF